MLVSCLSISREDRQSSLSRDRQIVCLGKPESSFGRRTWDMLAGGIFVYV